MHKGKREVGYGVGEARKKYLEECLKIFRFNENLELTDEEAQKLQTYTPTHKIK